jgi:hypothetical protein
MSTATEVEPCRFEAFAKAAGSGASRDSVWLERIRFRLAKRVVCLVLLLLAVGEAGTAHAQERRFALVIGNSDYEFVGALQNPTNDATDIGKALERLGFSVTTALNLDYNQMRLALRDFGEVAADADMALVYFAGHGIEIDNTNYLIPVNAELKSDRDVEFEAVRLETVIASIETSRGIKIILVDACRNNPFVADMTRTVASRSIGRGLGRIDPGGVLVGYSARGGTISLDGDGRNSPYAKALLDLIDEPGLEIGKLFRRVRDAVLDETAGAQEPFTYGSLPGEDIFLMAPAPVDDSAADRPALEVPDDSAAAEWPDFRTGTSPEALLGFAKRHEGTAYAALARERVAALQQPSMPRVPLSDAPSRLPDWCAAPRSDTERTICSTSGLVASALRADNLHQKQLAASFGDTRGQALIDLMEWRRQRDGCKSDAACIARAYDLRILALAEFDATNQSETLVIRSVQEQLNRLSCGAGEPDGVAGGQTRSALATLAARHEGIPDNANPASVTLLETLRGLPKGLCSLIAVAADRPEAIAGTWAVTATCPEESGWPNETKLYALTLAPDGDSQYRGRIVRSDGFSGAVGARLAPDSVNVTVVWESGSRSSLSLLPGSSPASFTGEDSHRCELFVDKQ